MRSVLRFGGESYCDTCVRVGYDSCVRATGSYSDLSEDLRADATEAIKTELYSCGLVGSIFMFILFQTVQDLLVAVIIAILIVGFTVVLRANAGYESAKRLSGKVEIKGERLNVSHRLYGNFSWPLEDCKWRIGKATDARSFCPKLHLWRKVIIVECPVAKTLIGTYYEKVPCGFTDEAMRLWCEAFTRRGVEKLHDKLLLRALDLFRTKKKNPA